MDKQTQDSWVEDGDYTVVDHHSVFLVYPQNEDALNNLLSKTADDSMFMGDALVVEHRFIRDLIDIFNNEGWRVC